MLSEVALRHDDNGEGREQGSDNEAGNNEETRHVLEGCELDADPL